MSKIRWRFFFIVVANVHLSLIKFSFFLEGIFLSPIVLIVFNKSGPIRMQYLSVCQEGADGSCLLL